MSGCLSLKGVSTEANYYLFSHQITSDSSVTPWTVAYQAPLSMDFSRQEYWSGLPFPSPGDLLISTGMWIFFFFFFNTEPPGKLNYYLEPLFHLG